MSSRPLRGKDMGVGTHSSNAKRMFSSGSGPSRATAFIIASAIVPVSIAAALPGTLPPPSPPRARELPSRSRSSLDLDVSASRQRTTSVQGVLVCVQRWPLTTGARSRPGPGRSTRSCRVATPRTEAQMEMA